MGHLSLGYWTSVLISVVLHEAAHLVTAFALHVRVKRVGLNWRGPYIVREPGPPVENTLISLAGPGINLVLCLLSYHVAPTFAFRKRISIRLQPATVHPVLGWPACLSHLEPSPFKGVDAL